MQYGIVLVLVPILLRYQKFHLDEHVVSVFSILIPGKIKFFFRVTYFWIFWSSIFRNRIFCLRKSLHTDVRVQLYHRRESWRRVVTFIVRKKYYHATGNRFLQNCPAAFVVVGAIFVSDAIAFDLNDVFEFALKRQRWRWYVVCVYLLILRLLGKLLI